MKRVLLERNLIDKTNNFKKEGLQAEADRQEKKTEDRTGQDKSYGQRATSGEGRGCSVAETESEWPRTLLRERHPVMDNFTIVSPSNWSLRDPSPARAILSRR